MPRGTNSQYHWVYRRKWKWFLLTPHRFFRFSRYDIHAMNTRTLISLYTIKFGTIKSIYDQPFGAWNIFGAQIRGQQLSQWSGNIFQIITHQFMGNLISFRRLTWQFQLNEPVYWTPIQYQLRLKAFHLRTRLFNLKGYSNKEVENNDQVSIYYP